MVTLITIALAGVLVSLGMSGYARVQKWCFYGGLLGMLIMVILMLVVSKNTFISSFNAETAKLFGFKDSYAGTITDAGSKAIGYTPSPFGMAGAFGQSMLLVPMLMFYLLWPNWGTTLYGEVRGASDFKRVFSGMFFGLWTTVLLSVVLLSLFAKFFGFNFYQDVNALWIDNVYGIASPHALPIFPYPVLLVGWAVHNQVFQVILILLMSLWFFGWVGTLFLSSTRVIFAAAFDRILPDGAAQVSEKRRVPVWSLVLMLLASGRAGGPVLVQLDVPHLHAGRDAGHRGDVPVLRDRRGDPAVAQAGPVGCLPRLRAQAARRTDRARRRPDHHRAHRVLPVRVAVQQRVRDQQQRLADLHGRDVRARAGDLPRGADRPLPPGHRPLPDQQGDPGRVARRVSRCDLGTALAASRAQLCQALRRTRIMRQAEAASRVVVSSKSP